MIFLSSYSGFLEVIVSNFSSKLFELIPFLLIVLKNADSLDSNMDARICSVPKISYPFAVSFATALSNTSARASPS